jgi:hypothetical protein
MPNHMQHELPVAGLLLAAIVALNALAGLCIHDEGAGSRTWPMADLSE